MSNLVAYQWDLLLEVIANLLMTELEKHLLNELFENNVIEFYARYVDDTLVLVNSEDIDNVIQRLIRIIRMPSSQSTLSTMVISPFF